jgi:DNA-binding SARP family transcriptional activator
LSIPWSIPWTAYLWRRGIRCAIPEKADQGRSPKAKGRVGAAISEYGCALFKHALASWSSVCVPDLERRVLFRILGPLEIGHDDDDWQGVRAPKWRALLGALLILPEVVPVERLVDELWVDHPPAGARKLVSGYVSQLRRLIGDPRGQILVTRPSGYQMLVPRNGVDAGRFEELLAGARTMMENGDADPAADAAARGLALWRGRALADVPPGPLVTAEADRLEELRLAAVELRIDAILRQGREAELAQLIPSLRRLTGDHPLRERFWYQRMQVLDACGRRAEALETYADARAVLAAELGADPGPDLQRLHQRILVGDPIVAHSSPANSSHSALDPVTSTAAPPTAVPRQLPTGVRHFAGRAEEIQRLTWLADEAAGAADAGVIVAISGIAGIGKTTLAVQCGRRVADRFPDGQLYANLRGFDAGNAPVHPEEAIHDFLGALGIAADQIPSSLTGQVALYRSLLADKRMIVMLDNARDAEQVRPLLPGAPGCLVLITGRRQLISLAAAEEAQLIALAPLTTTEARELLDSRLGAERISAEPAATAELIGLCAGLPLALAIVASRAAVNPDIQLTALAAELHAAERRLDGLSADDMNVRGAFSWSYGHLGGEAARMFRLLAVHPGPDLTAAAAASLAGASPERARQILAELTAVGLLVERAGRYLLHDLLRVYAAEQVRAQDSAADRHAATRRLLDHYLHTAHAAALLMRPTRERVTLSPPQPGVTPEHLADQQQAMDWFGAEHHVLISAASMAADAGCYIHAWKIPWTMADFLDRRGHWHDYVATQRTALAAASRLGDVIAQAMASRLLATAFRKLAEYDRARTHIRFSLHWYHQAGDQAGQARAHRLLSQVAESQGRYAEALGHASQALSLSRALADRPQEADALNSVGWYHAMLGAYQQARAFCWRALILHRELGNRHSEAAAWDSLGYIDYRRGRHTVAVRYFESALGLFREVGDRYHQADTLAHLGDAHYDSDEPQRARGAWEEALRLLSELNHPDASKLRTRLYGDDVPTRQLQP